MNILSNAGSSIQYRDSFISIQSYVPFSIFNMQHTRHRLLFVLSGAATVEHGADVYRMEAGQLIFLKRDIAVSLTAGDASLEIITAVIGEELLLEFTRMAALPEGPALQDAVTVHDSTPQLEDYFITLVHYFTSQNGVEPSLARIKLLELLFCTGAKHPALLKQLLQWKQQVYGDIMAVVCDNLENSLTLSRLAKLSGRCLSSFKRDFHAINNMAPSRWIRQKKLEKAKEMVANTSLAVADVCYTLGFGNVTHFSRLFKSYFGVSPSEFKRNKQQLKVA